ncbi:MAG: crossover junction endodeoxyribonuclease RuvC [bacterium]|nr:crossover junction endodeoxyribonuclease RuvC [bacterium]
MIIIGIDPGSTRIGYGVIETGSPMRAKDYGVIEIKRKESSLLIKEAARALTELIARHKPTVVGIEKIYFAKNVKTGIEVAQTRGALILTLAEHNIPVHELSPSEVKLAVTNYGLSDKKAVAKMVGLLLNIERVAGYDDASDALAIAIATAGKLPSTQL